MPATTSTLGVTDPNASPFQPTGALSGAATPPATTANSTAAPTGALSTGTGVSSTNPTALTGALGTATTWTPSESDMASSRLTSMLSTDSPYLTRARSRAAQYANSRGLLNSSIAATAGEAAAIDAAAPIATADAATLARAGEFNAGAQNTFTTQGNDFQMRGALAQYDAQTTAEQNQLQRDATASENALGRAEQARQFDAGQGLTRQVGVSDRVAALRQNALNQIAQIETSGLDTAGKAAAMQRVWDQLDISIQDAVRTSGVTMPETWSAFIGSMQDTVTSTPTAAPGQTRPPGELPADPPG